MCADCFEAELSKERDADPQENASAEPISPVTETGNRIMRPLVEFIFPHRLHRLAYLLRIIVWIVFLYVVRDTVFASLYADRDTTFVPYSFAGFVALSLYGIFFILLPRLRDVGMSAWWLIVALIPVANTLLGIILLFRAPEYHSASPASETQET